MGKIKGHNVKIPPHENPPDIKQKLNWLKSIVMSFVSLKMSQISEDSCFTKAFESSIDQKQHSKCMLTIDFNLTKNKSIIKQINLTSTVDVKEKKITDSSHIPHHELFM